MKRTPLKEPLNSNEHYLYCITERLDILIDALTASDVTSAPVEGAVVAKPKRTRKAPTKE